LKLKLGRYHWGIVAVAVISLAVSTTVTAASREHAVAPSQLETTAGPSCSSDACELATVRADQHWLSSGMVPGGPKLRSMALGALLDLHAAVQPDGAVIAGWRPGWEYSWPRDSSWVAAALAQTGHHADAFRILRFLQRTQLPDGRWAARYWPDGAPVADGRPSELDADGWVPWAVWSWSTGSSADHGSVTRGLAQLWPMVQAAATATIQAISPSGLPVASMDYWEHGVQVTLGTAAPLLAGLRAAAAIAGELGAGSFARRWDQAAASLAHAITGTFGRSGYHRLPSAGAGADAAVTFLGPPFEEPDPAVSRAVASSQDALTLPNGGLLPGSDWSGSKTTAWTAETAFFALFAAETGHQQGADQILAWLAAHRTAPGALPEMVTAQGKPASVAPLAWTDAVVLLTLVAQTRSLPIAPGAKL
jgi:glucoamylase